MLRSPGGFRGRVSKSPPTRRFLRSPGSVAPVEAPAADDNGFNGHDDSSLRVDADGHLHRGARRTLDAHPGPHHATPVIFDGVEHGRGAAHHATLRLVTLNVAHGRGARFHQTLLRRRTIEGHLTAIATVFDRERPDVVALQEADGPCTWSGGFDHVDWLARNGGFGWHLRGSHVQGRRLDYGTALLSRLEPRDPVAVTFRPSPPTPSKGFVVATVEHAGHTIDLVSVHLDFSRGRIRRRQVHELAQVLDGRDHLRVVMGDLNCDWRERGGTLRLLSDLLGVQPHEPEAHEGHGTFRGRARLDWVLTTPSVGVLDYRVLPDRVSDHRAVLAHIQLP